MPTERNPSLTLSQHRLDLIIDKLTEGKNCKYPPSVEDVWATGMMPSNEYTIREYVRKRWGLTPAGTTMRTRKLMARMTPYRSDAMDHPEAVWKVKGGYYSNTECFVSGRMSPTLREGTWLMWGWLFNESSSVKGAADLRFDIVGLGGNREALTRNQGLVEYISDRIERYRKQESEAAKERARYEDLLGQVQGMNAMMTAAVADEVLG